MHPALEPILELNGTSTFRTGKTNGAPGKKGVWETNSTPTDREGNKGRAKQIPSSALAFHAPAEATDSLSAPPPNTAPFSPHSPAPGRRLSW